MGHQISAIDRLFKNVNYNTKTSPEIREAMTQKLEALRTSIENRERRTARICEDHSIDAERLAILVMRFQEGREFVSYERQGGAPEDSLVPAGVIANLVREREMIDSEKDQIWKIELVLRNIRDEEMYYHPRTGEIQSRTALHTLSDHDLEYLGF